MLGAPGAGKGTQAALLASRLGLAHVSSGELFRQALRDGTPLGREAQSYMDRGALVPDEVTIRMIDERLHDPDAAPGVILDGFPRTQAQAEALEALLAGREAKVDAAMYVSVELEELIRRLSGRWLCEAADHVYHETSRPPKQPGVCDIDGSPLYQRSDDEPATVRQRLERQLVPMFEVVAYYRERGLLSEVDGGGAIDEVTEALLRAVTQPAH
jgi:adenylate kinase